MAALFEIEKTDKIVRVIIRNEGNEVTDIWEQDLPGRFMLNRIVEEFMGPKFAVRKVRR